MLRRRGAPPGQLELYRSGDFEKIAPYEGKLAALGVPALLLWGQEDQFAPPAAATASSARSRTPSWWCSTSAGHFVWEDEPERCARP